jgi:hypothetical protein
VTEAEFQKIVIDMSHLFGWRVAHFRPARVTRNGKETWETPVAADGRGFPDLVLAKAGRTLFRELKTNSGKVSDEQHEWLKATGGKVWRPRHLDSGLIEEILRG